jgi:hypothetical protein
VKRDAEVLAEYLLARGKPMLVVWCARHLHRIGSVYPELPAGHGVPEGPILCVRGWKMRSEQWQGPEFAGGMVSAPTIIYSIYSGARAVAARCKCGGQQVHKTDVAAALAEGSEEISAVRTFNPEAAVPGLNEIIPPLLDF